MANGTWIYADSPLRSWVISSVLGFEDPTKYPKAEEWSAYVLLAEALRDVYHVPHRARLIPSFDTVVDAGRRAGAFGVTISGSGPTLLVLHAPGADARARVATAMVRAFKRAGVRARAIPGRIAARGAVTHTLG